MGVLPKEGLERFRASGCQDAGRLGEQEGVAVGEGVARDEVWGDGHDVAPAQQVLELDDRVLDGGALRQPRRDVARLAQDVAIVDPAAVRVAGGAEGGEPVSYTHLTLPTIA